MRNIIIFSSLMLLLASCSSPSVTSTGSRIPGSGWNIFSHSGGITRADRDYEKRMEWVPWRIANSWEYWACMTESVNMCQNRAFSQIVSSLNDVTSCDGFESDELITRCKDMIYATKAYTTLESDFCNKLSTGSQECLLSITIQKASETEDITLCDTFTPKNEIKNMSGSMSSDGMLEKDRCILWVVERSMAKIDTKMQKDVCDRVSDTGSSLRCKDSFRMMDMLRKKMWNPPPLPTLGTGKILTGSGER